jgi:hypothetical protein
MMRRRALIAVLAAGVLLAAGCGREGEDAVPAAAETTAERGPVQVTVRAPRSAIDVGEKLDIAVDVVFEAGVEVRMPVFEDSLGPFAIRGVRTPPDTPVAPGTETTRRWVHTWTVDTFSAGSVTVPEITVAFTDARTDDVVESSVVTESLAIEVRSALTGDEGEADYRDIRTALEVPVGMSAAGWIVASIAAAVLVAGAGGLLAWRARRRGAEATVPEPPAHVWALRMLAALEADDLIGRGDAEAFYTRLSGIVREYIERRFGIMAPERTTEEFLREARRSASLEDRHKSLLAEFLRAADLVKFARHVPTTDECRAAFDAARGFVEQTAPSPAPAQEVAA